MRYSPPSSEVGEVEGLFDVKSSLNVAASGLWICSSSTIPTSIPIYPSIRFLRKTVSQYESNPSLSRLKPWTPDRPPTNFQLSFVASPCFCYKYLILKPINL